MHFLARRWTAPPLLLCVSARSRACWNPSSKQHLGQVARQRCATGDPQHGIAGRLRSLALVLASTHQLATMSKSRLQTCLSADFPRHSFVFDLALFQNRHRASLLGKCSSHMDRAHQAGHLCSSTVSSVQKDSKGEEHFIFAGSAT